MPHGGVAVVKDVISRLERAGIKQARNQAWPEAESDVEARMLEALSRAPSPLAIDLLLDQPRRWRESDAHDPALDATLDRLLNPPLVVAIGATNIGKSSLANALAGRTMAIVADEPATTRDHVGIDLTVDGLVIRYVDTPGTGASTDGEAAAIAEELTARADLVLCCGDPGTPPPSSERPSLTAALRSDLGIPAFTHHVKVCARTGEGLDRLTKGHPRGSHARRRAERFASLALLERLELRSPSEDANGRKTGTNQRG